ncbi:hypothetical protein SDC9_157433 [bioreactor metagenome]|uniref:Uncharacterized protein n=1 Tax=bioreactor metagenome TaxID=1076179 RepID=A0A645F6Y3_9ZZZZ
MGGCVDTIVVGFYIHFSPGYSKSGLTFQSFSLGPGSTYFDGTSVNRQVSVAFYPLGCRIVIGIINILVAGGSHRYSSSVNDQRTVGTDPFATLTCT